MSTRVYAAILSLLFIFSGCTALSTNSSRAPEVQAIMTPVYPTIKPAVHHEGSLWSEALNVDLYPDRRARKVGDVLTIRIVEDPEAELDANTKTSRASGLSAAKLKFFGYMKALALSNPNLAQDPGTDDLALASLGLSFDGKGTSDRKGHVKAYISAVVVGVLPNGNLFINGKREIKVNNEAQFLTISGIVRPEDISPTNEISSTYVANAKITYGGVGVLADKQKPGILQRVTDHVWPF
jgi:flagellar L-ring protein precursor FlgH